nr:hypothetical protein [Gramella crocea]
MISRPLWPLVEYAVNYDYIVDKLCENKDKPEMECNGKCYLTKQLAEEAAGEKEDPYSNKTSKIEIPLIIISERLPEFHFAYVEEFITLNDFGCRPDLYNSLFVTRILHPPQLMYFLLGSSREFLRSSIF